MLELWERSQIRSFLPAHSKSRFSATSKAISTATSMLPAKPYPPLPARSQQSQIHHYQLAPSEASFTPTSEAISSATSLLPGKPVSPLPAKPHSPLTACSQRSQIVREVRVSMSEQCDQACQSFKREYAKPNPPQPACFWRD